MELYPVQYDLAIILELCDELELSTNRLNNEEIEIVLANDLTLCVQNIENDDCLIGFKGTPWHMHGDAMFSGQRGYNIEIQYLDIFIGLNSGHILICELWENELLVDRYLTHAEYNDEFRFLTSGQKLVVRTVAGTLSMAT